MRDAELWTAVNAKLASLRQADGTNATPWAQLQVEAFIATVATGDAVARVPQVGVLIDYQTIRDGLHAHSICELDNGTSIPVSTARRLNVWCQTPNVRMQNGESIPVTVFVNELEICDTTGGLCSAADRKVPSSLM